MRLLAGVALALALALPAGAAGATRHVAKTGSDSTNCTNAASPCATIGYAVSQAADDDTIQIGPGTFVEEVNTAKRLTYVGAGRIGPPTETTTIQGPNGTSGMVGRPALSLPNGGTVRSLRAQGGTGGSSVPWGELGGDAIQFNSNAAAPASLLVEDALVVGGNGGTGTEGVGPAGTGIDSEDGPGPISLSVVDSEVRGGVGLGNGGGIWVDGTAATALISNSQIPNLDSFGAALFVTGGAQTTVEGSTMSADYVVSMYEGSLTIARSRLESEGGTIYVSPSSGESPEVTIRDSLVISSLAMALSVVTEEGSSAAVDVFGSTLIGHGESAVTATRPENAGPAAVTLRNTVARQIIPPESPSPQTDLVADGGSIAADYSSFAAGKAENGGTVSAPGSAHNVAGDPLLLDEGNGVYVPRNESPLVDAGDPGVVAAAELDLLGSPRNLDGDRDCIPAPDIGAFEVTGQEAACIVDPAPELTRFTMTNRVFAPAAGKRRSKARPALTSKRRRRGFKRGTRFKFVLSEPAKVEIAIARRLPGVRVRRAGRTRCVALKRRAARPPKRARCFRFAKPKTLTSRERAGRQSLPFSGWIGGRPLKPGRYRATILATDPAGQESKPSRASFRVVRAPKR